MENLTAINYKKIYRYVCADGTVKVSPNKPSGEHTEKLRLVAEEGKALTKDGKEFYSCIDVDTAEGWYEVDAPKEWERGAEDE